MLETGVRPSGWTVPCTYVFLIHELSGWFVLSARTDCFARRTPRISVLQATPAAQWTQLYFNLWTQRKTNMCMYVYVRRPYQKFRT